MKIRKPTTPSRAVTPGLGHKIGTDKAAENTLVANPERDVFGGAAERLLTAHRSWDPDGARKLDDTIKALISMAPELSDRLAGNGLSAVGLVRGVGKGLVVRNAEQARDAIANKNPFVLVLTKSTPELLELATHAEALVVVGRNTELNRVVAAIGRPAIRMAPGVVTSVAGFVSVDGTQGALVRGNAKVIGGTTSSIATASIDELRSRFKLNVTAQASTVENIAQARMFGADRVRVDGLALLSGARPMAHVRRYLLETEAAPRRDALEHIVSLARVQARELLGASGDLPTTFVLGDTAPHSFFPSNPAQLDALATEMGLPKQLVRDRVGELGGGNSKLGLRGARWAVKDPELFAAWARAIFEAYADGLEAGQKPGALRLHIPNVALGGELGLVKARLEQERKIVEDEYGVSLPVSYSAGIDTARGALSTDEICEHADALEYSAADMTETLYAISRDDAAQYLPKMLNDKLLPADPFAQMDVDAVGKMIRVGQFLAGETPNTFPAALSGPQTLTANGMFVAAQSGVRDVIVPAASVITARTLDARVQAALKAGVGSTVPNGELRDTSSKLFDYLVQRTPKVEKPKASAIPAEVTALEHVERLQKLVESGAMTTAEALLSVPANIVDQLSKPVIDPKVQVQALAKGIAASPGCGQGRVALSKEAAAEFEKAGEPYILIVNEVHADEVEATRKAAGLISVRGGKTSHAAMIASNSDVPCVMQEKVQINLDNKTVAIGKARVQEGEFITIDGTKGQILPGQVPLLNPTKSTAFSSLMEWADEHRTLEVLANADTPQEAATAFARGAQGVGLVRSEHMFYEADRLKAFRSVILSDIGARPAEFAALEKAQTDDYTALFETARARKVSVRLLDPPLYEFLPQKPEEIKELAHALGLPAETLLKRINDAQEVDSMLGMRGVRLALVRPDIEAMQVRALARAYVAASKSGECAPLHIIVPQVSAAAEMEAARGRILAVVAEVEKESGTSIPVKLGSMIETPRAALEAHHIAEHVDFFSYGTNDLTQGTLGYGRNVAAKFIPELIKSKALDADPTESLDDKGVVKLIRVAESLGKDSNPALYGGVCGGQAGDPASIASLQQANVKYISVSPGQVAKARLAAGQAAVGGGKPTAESTGAAATQARLKELTSGLQTALRAIKTVPTDAAAGELLGHLEHLVREGSTAIRVARRSVVAFGTTEPLMRAVVAARELLDTNKLARALVAECAQLRNDVLQHLKNPARGTAERKLDVAQTAARTFGELATAQLNAPHSTASERKAAAEAWTALRAFEEVRTTLSDAGALPAAHAHATRLWHHNDGWDNPHYTQGGPQNGESMIAFMKRAAVDFLDDNDLEVNLAGFDLSQLPKDRPIILAVSHRSGAIDRFATMGSLPFDDDELMYVVRKGSPYDVIATENFKPKENPIIAPESADDLLARAKEGFANGKRVLLTYPQGTGSIVGESRYPASSTVRLALETGAVLVPVTLQDTFSVRPMSGGQVTVWLHPPLDSAEVARDAKFAGIDAEGILHTQLHYELSKSFRAGI